ncbi:MAG: hypothetical protein Q8763_02975, partial [Candidatus Phytoplasma australasiaticum]|nr:hypothetical protein [Candidatus Phytoplasma australasiaticum]
IFKKLYQNQLAVLQDVEVNFCPNLGTVLDVSLITMKMLLSQDGRDNWMYFSDHPTFPLNHYLSNQPILIFLSAHRIDHDPQYL